MILTQNEFQDFKQDYAVYGTHTEQDKYKNEYIVKDDSAKGTIHTMWHPMSDAASIAEYGKDISKMMFAIVYEDIAIDYNDIITLFGDEYEVVGIKRYNTHKRIEVRRKKA